MKAIKKNDFIFAMFDQEVVTIGPLLDYDTFAFPSLVEEIREVPEGVVVETKNDGSFIILGGPTLNAMYVIEYSQSTGV